MSVELDLNLFVDLSTLATSSVFVLSDVCFVSVLGVAVSLDSLGPVGLLRLVSQWRSLQTRATGVDDSTSVALEMHQQYLGDVPSSATSCCSMQQNAAWPSFLVSKARLITREVVEGSNFQVTVLSALRFRSQDSTVVQAC